MALTEFDFNRLFGDVVLPPSNKKIQGSRDVIERFAMTYPDLSLAAPVKVESTQFGTPQVMWLKWKLSSQTKNDWWLLPIEPLITVNGKNVLVKRNVAKSSLRGTIKERWMQDDYSISIQGLFTRKDSYEYPSSDLKKLRDLCEAKEPIDVLCPLFEELGITRIVIESYDIPFTKGEENQNWQVNALSDDDWQLLINIDNQNKNVL